MYAKTLVPGPVAVPSLTATTSEADVVHATAPRTRVGGVRTRATTAGLVEAAHQP